MTWGRDGIDAVWGYTPFMARWVRLGYFLALVGAVWCVLSLSGSTPFQDRWILLGVGSVYALAAIVMLIGTRYWTIRGLGLFGTVTGDAMFYLALASPQFGWTGRATDDYFNIIRALFIVGGALLLIGLCLWLVRTHAGTRDEPDGVIV